MCDSFELAVHVNVKNNVASNCSHDCKKSRKFAFERLVVVLECRPDGVSSVVMVVT